ncbi:hypothetical protein [Clostridium scatologenes]|uniref:Uncharacterized protein n=1 Tax=Clostridium scatologenes TaxID=1548 RepID=A0A0E3M7Z7_CLOSL|nr:hypothetical protein [Clostridium scatologenes]AKA69297.1 hypothetical protein CSCA_2172 [Clostridium scatologenes]
MNNEQFHDFFQKCINSFEKFYDEIVEEHPEWEKNKDERVLILKNVCNILKAANLNCIPDKKFLEDVSNKSGTNYTEKHEAINDSMIKIGFISVLCSTIEFSFRMFAKQYDIEDNRISKVYKNLFYRLNIKEYDAITITTYIRNAISHNNQLWIYDNKEIEYKGKVYKFEKNRIVKYTTWEDFFHLLPGIIDIIFEVVNSTDISRLYIIRE